MQLIERTRCFSIISNALFKGRNFPSDIINIKFKQAVLY